MEENRNSCTFSTFVNDLWGNDASCERELLTFFEQAEQSKFGGDGNNHGEVHSLRLCVRPVFHYLDPLGGHNSIESFLGSEQQL